MGYEDCLQLHVCFKPYSFQHVRGEGLIREILKAFAEPLQVEIRLDRFLEVGNDTAFREALGAVPDSTACPGVNLGLAYCQRRGSLSFHFSDVRLSLVFAYVRQIRRHQPKPAIQTLCRFR